MTQVEAKIQKEREELDVQIEKQRKKYLSANLNDKMHLMDELRILNERRNTLSHVLELMWEEEAKQWQTN